MMKYNFWGVWKAYAKFTKKGWFTCSKIIFYVFVCSSWFFFIISSLKIDFIAKIYFESFFSTNSTVPKAPFPNTAFGIKSFIDISCFPFAKSVFVVFLTTYFSSSHSYKKRLKLSSSWRINFPFNSFEPYFFLSSFVIAYIAKLI